MKLCSLSNPVERKLRGRGSSFASALSLGLVLLTGCQTVRLVNKTTIAPHLMDATLDQLLERMDTEYASVKSFQARVLIDSSTGGPRTGKVTDNPQLKGFILLRKPSDLRVLMQKPYIGSRAIDMASDGKTFRLFYASLTKTGAYEGPDAPATSPKGGLESLRPNIIRDALLVPPLQPEELVSETEESRVISAAHGKQGAVEEPDYDIAFMHTLPNHRLERARVVHFSRTTLLPYQQDIYLGSHIVTTVQYENYQKFGDVEFPMIITITRPLDEYSLKITVTKLTLNEKVDDEEFLVQFPEGIKVQKMQ